MQRTRLARPHFPRRVVSRPFAGTKENPSRLRNGLGAAGVALSRRAPFVVAVGVAAAATALVRLAG